MARAKQTANRLRQSFFEGLITRYTEELQLNEYFIKFNVAIYFIIVLLSCTKVKDVLFTDILNRLGSTQIALVIFPLYVALLGFLLVVHFRGVWRGENATLFLRFSIYMKITFTYIVYPFTAWTLSNLVYTKVVADRSGVGYFSVVLSIIFIVLGAILIFFILLLRNTFWTKYLLSSINPWTEILSYMSILIVQIIHPSLLVHNSQVLRIAFYIFSDVLLGLNFWHILSRLPFWNIKMNALYLKPFTAILFIKIFLEVCPSSVAQSMEGLICLGIAKLTFRLVPNLIYNRSRIYVFQKGIDSARRYVGMTLLQTYIFKPAAEVEPEESNLYAFYTGQWRDYLKRSNPWEQGEQSPQRLLVDFMQHLNPNDPSNVKLLLTLQLADPLPWLSTLHATMARFKSLTNSGFTGNFQYYHFKRVLEIKLDALYKGKVKADEKQESNSILTLYQNTAYYLRSTSQSSEDSLDICKVFHWIEVHQTIVKMATKMIEKLSSIFTTLSTGEDLSTGNLYNLNRETMTTDKEILAIIKKTTQEDESLPSYIYPTIIFYLSLVRNRIRQAERVYKDYKLKLQQLQVAYERFNSLVATHKDRRASLINTVALVTSLDQQSLGQIVLASLDYGAHLGYPEKGEAVGKNLDALLPRPASIAHREKLSGGGLNRVLVGHRAVFSTGFDGLLRPCEVEVRLHPQADQGLRAACRSESRNWPTTRGWCSPTRKASCWRLLLLSGRDWPRGRRPTPSRWPSCRPPWPRPWACCSTPRPWPWSPRLAARPRWSTRSKTPSPSWPTATRPPTSSTPWRKAVPGRRPSPRTGSARRSR